MPEPNDKDKAPQSMGQTESGSKIPKDAAKQPGESDTDYAKRRMKEEWESIKHPGK